jgi:two-component system, LuxR family, response regulator FixJ
MNDAPLVYVVDDDADVRDSLRMLLDSVNIAVRTFDTADRFLEGYRPQPQSPACLLLDVRMPGMSGMTLLKQLRALDPSLPVVVLTGHGDVPMAVQAMKMGAVDFISKPFNHQTLLDLVQDVLRRRRNPASRVTGAEEAVGRWRSLSPRERDVFERIVAGDSNKVIALDLGISIRTVEAHRARVMEKMKARTLVELVLLSVQLKGAVLEGGEGESATDSEHHEA